MTPAPITDDSIVQWHGTPLAATVGDQVVIMNAALGTYHGLDEIGSDVWNRLERPTRVADLCVELLAGYDAPPGALESDVRRLLGELLDQGLIDVR